MAQRETVWHICVQWTWNFRKTFVTAERPSGVVEGEEGCVGEVRRVQRSVSTATGSLHKAVVSGDGRARLVEEIQLFPDPEPVRNLQLAPTQVGRDPMGWVWGGVLGPCQAWRERPDTLHLSSRVHCLQASQEAS